MNRLINAVDGYKTYIGGAIVFCAGGLYFTRMIDESTAEAMALVGTAISVGGIRHAISKMER